MIVKAERCKMKNIPLEVARRFIISKQLLLQSAARGSAQEVVDVIRRLGGAQYDPLPVVEKAHYLTVWNRVKNFKKEVLDGALYKERKLIEFVLMRQALHIIPVDELPYYYQAVQSVFRRGWIQRAINNLSKQDAQKIVEMIKSNGMVSSKDFPYGKLRALFYKGKIGIAKREPGIFRMPYYCLLSTLHPHLNLQTVDEDTAQKWLVLKTVSAYGLASARHIGYWIGYKVKETKEILDKLEKEKLVKKVKVVGLKGYHWMTSEDFSEIQERIEKTEKVALLSPMDNLTRDRKWLDEVFDYSFSIEYFQKKGMRWQISILYDTSFLGFIDAKIDRSHRMFIIKEFAVRFSAQKDVWIKVARRIVDFARFHGATTISIGAKCPKWLSDLFGKLGYEHKDKLVTIAE